MRVFLGWVIFMSMVGCVPLQSGPSAKKALSPIQYPAFTNSTPLWVALPPVTNQQTVATQARVLDTGRQTNAFPLVGVSRPTNAFVMAVPATAFPPVFTNASKMALVTTNVSAPVEVSTLTKVSAPLASNITTKAVAATTNAPVPIATAPVEIPTPSKVSAPLNAPLVKNIAPDSASVPVRSAAEVTQASSDATTGVVAVTRSSGYVRREHLNFRNEEVAQLFLRQMARKAAVIEEIRVVSRLVDEKNAEFVQFGQALKEQFSVSADANYNYDARNMTIYEVEAKATEREGKGRVAEATAQREHLKVKDKKSEQQFLQLVAARRLTAEELKALQFIVREKNMELELRERELSASYSISKDRAYQYNPQNLTLYELVPTPKGRGGADDADGNASVK